jgi:hypothetical protein
MRQRTVKRRPRRWTLRRLHRECRSAAVVYLGLCDFADESESPHVTPTREHLSKATGIERLPTISAALTALSKARWISLDHVPVTENNKQVGTVLQIKLLRRANENRYVGENATRQAQSRPRRNENRSKSSLREQGRAPRRPFPLTGGRRVRPVAPPHRRQVTTPAPSIRQPE